jgi:tetratricopeptide (TPR) repeat protein
VADLSVNSPTPRSEKRVRTRTYSIGLYLVVFVILLQISAVVSVFWLRRAVQVDLEAPRLRATSVVALPAPPLPPPPADPIPPTTPAPVKPARPQPESQVLQPQASGRLDLAAALDPQARILALNIEARRFQSEGDADLARAALLEAENLSPSHPATLRLSAEIAEQQGDRARALTYWQRLLALGSAAAEHSEIAGLRVQVLSAPPAPTRTIPNSLLSAGPIELTVTLDNETTYEFNLKIPITRQANAPEIKPADVAIKLYFYDLNEKGEIIPTSAARKTFWLGNNPDWLKQSVEVLGASYRLTRSAADNKFFGYVFRLYYQGRLQDEKGQPARILAMFPVAPSPAP